MKTQISRLPDTLHTPWSGVYQQQGRMIADADWNALTEVMKARLNDALFDIVGSGSPDRGGIVASDGAGTYELVWGTA